MRSLKIQCGVRTPSRRSAVIWGGFQDEKGVSAPLTLQSRCEEGKMRVLIGLLVHGILQTQQKSRVSLVPSRRFIGDHASQFSKLRVRMHYSTLHD